MANNDVQTLANSIIGTSILAMPYVFQRCGVILSIILLILSTIITRTCCHYLIKASIVTRRKNMELLGFYIFGNSGKTLVELSVIGFLMGTCIAFFVVIGDLLPLIVIKMFSLQHYNHDSVRHWLIIIITVVCIIPLSFQKSMQSLSFVCKASIAFYICLTIKTVFESFSRFQSDDHWASNIKLWNSDNILQCLPILSMAMSCQMQLFEIYENITSFDRIRQNIFHATSICFVVYTVIGFFGYAAFSNQTLSGNFLLNFPSSFANDIITIGFILSIACSFPLVIFPCRTSLSSLIYRKVHHSEISPYVQESRYKPLTLFIIISTMIVGIMIPSVEVIIGFVGSTIGTLICVIFPATCFVKIMQRNQNEKIIAQLMIFIGFVIMILGTYSNLKSLDSKSSGSHIETIHPLHPNDIVNEMPQIVLPKSVVKNETKISEDGIKKEDQEIAAQQEIKEKDIEIKELKASKDKLEKEVLEMKQVLVKQNKETQELVLQKFEEIAEKVDKIEKQSLDSVAQKDDVDIPKAFVVVKNLTDDPIVKLIKSQEPLSYQVGEKIMEEKKQMNLTAGVGELINLENLKEKLEEVKISLDKDNEKIKNAEIKSIVDGNAKEIIQNEKVKIPDDKLKPENIEKPKETLNNQQSKPIESIRNENELKNNENLIKNDQNIQEPIKVDELLQNNLKDDKKQINNPENNKNLQNDRINEDKKLESLNNQQNKLENLKVDENKQENSQKILNNQDNSLKNPTNLENDPKIPINKPENAINEDTKLKNTKNLLETIKNNENHQDTIIESNNQQNINHEVNPEDIKNEMRKKRSASYYDDLFSNINPLTVQLKSVISRDLKAVNDET